MMGMGRMGSAVPERHYGIWEGSHDSFWMGDHRGGIYCELRGASYTGPLLDLFRPGHPQSWWNDRKGGFSIRRDSSRALATVFSGSRPLEAGRPIEFSFALIATPVKRLDFPRHFTDRYYHGGGLLPAPDDVRAGVRVVNLHHANQANPYLNYPFLATPMLRRFVDSAHAMGLKLKLYYTIRELTNHVAELWALRSLGDEVLADGPGGGFPWLREHLVSRISPRSGTSTSTTRSSEWTRRCSRPPALPAGTTTISRDWRGCSGRRGIDGLYLDDVSYDRQTVKRIRKVMEAVRPGCLIDLHSNTVLLQGTGDAVHGVLPVYRPALVRRGVPVRPDAAGELVRGGFGDPLRADRRDAGGRRQSLARNGLRHDRPLSVADRRRHLRSAFDLEGLGRLRDRGRDGERVLGGFSGGDDRSP